MPATLRDAVRDLPEDRSGAVALQDHGERVPNRRAEQVAQRIPLPPGDVWCPHGPVVLMHDPRHRRTNRADLHSLFRRRAPQFCHLVDDQPPHLIPVAALEQRDFALEHDAVIAEQRRGQLRRPQVQADHGHIRRSVRV